MNFSDDIARSLEILTQGGIILYPTDTIWGLGCDATNEKAVARLYRLKERKDSRSMLILVENQNSILQYIREIPDIAWELIEASGKPLTIIYPGAKNLAANLIDEDGSIGIRMVNDSFCSELIKQFRKPLVSTSANISEKTSPSVFSDIDDKIKKAVDYIVKWRQDDTEIKTASSIIKLDTSGRFNIIRH
ncbi:MAG: threonylcarbamoyl-AMP synthase [Bacteroidales bacterium]|nr:threonylcarbamoyl-AMP synthase [Bacteroidales bacterium]